MQNPKIKKIVLTCLSNVLTFRSPVANTNSGSNYSMFSTKYFSPNFTYPVGCFCLPLKTTELDTALLNKAQNHIQQRGRDFSDVELPSSRWVACSVYSSTLKMESE
jgi:hypothetical protein